MIMPDFYAVDLVEFPTLEEEADSPWETGGTSKKIWLQSSRLHCEIHFVNEHILFWPIL